MYRAIAATFLGRCKGETRTILANLLRRRIAVWLGAIALSSSVPSVIGATGDCRPAWTEMFTPPDTNSFYGIAAIARDDVWAVGSHYDGTDDRPLAEHFDGGSWTTVDVPAPGPYAAYLRGVGGFSGTDVWAVGYWTTASGSNKTLIEHYDGASWTIVPSPSPASFASYLNAIVAIATNNAWAAGYYLDNTGVYRTLVEHWDGTAWEIIATPNAGNGPNALN